jgi:D-psicose/D-tagatose/L-ribulose 3-epimerase
MKFGVNTLIWSIAFEPSLVPFAKLKQAAVDGIEVPCFDPVTFDAAAVRQSCDDWGMAATMCSICPADASPISASTADRSRARDHWSRVFECAVEVQAGVLAGPSFSPVGYLPGRRRTSEEWQHAVEFHAFLGERADDAGIDLAIEPINRFETYFLNTAADAVRLCEEVDHPQIGILLDTFHSNIEDKDVAQAYRDCGKHLKHVHTCENDRGTPGSGHVPWREIFTALRDIGYNGWLTIESFNASSPELAAATAIWRDLAASNDDIATDGIPFLRNLWTKVATR